MCNRIGYMWIVLAMLLAVVVGVWKQPHLLELSEIVSEIFMRLLKLISVPIISLSLLATLSSVGEQSHSRTGKRIVTYTIITTIISASIALSLYVIIKPVGILKPALDEAIVQPSYWDELLKLIPSNVVQPFLEGNVVSIMLLSVLLGLGIMQLPKAQREPVHQLLNSLFLVMMQLTRWIIKLMPIAVWGFMTAFVVAITKEGLFLKELSWYFTTVISANIIQASIILPAFLAWHGIKPLKAFGFMFPALSFAFFSKSSTAAMPTAIECAENGLHVKPAVARFSFPLCTSINMNACAAFILITVLFVSETYGVSFTFYEKLSWIVIATVAAIGNAGVPMGCFFLASALLTTMNVPITLMGVILPFYALLDMLESGINIWSDSCVTLIVDQKAKEEESEEVMESVSA